MPDSHSVELQHETTAAPPSVWAVLTDLDRAAEVLTGVDRVERLSGDGYQVGTRWRETRTMMGRSASEEMVVTAVEPGRSTTVEADAVGVHYRTAFTLAPLPEGGTRVTMVFSGSPVEPTAFQRLTWRLFGAWGLRMSAKAMRQDLADIAAAAERSGN
ncbi:MAG TPA: SRPBCC family protein [Actinotalea sp.]|nr:SRPBCC family protein [Actinotalea sp.]